MFSYVHMGDKKRSTFTWKALEKSPKVYTWEYSLHYINFRNYRNWYFTGKGFIRVLRNYTKLADIIS